jgi:multimeric flavodoxin WrbA/GNAT superfamily N-acetyltransferase
MGLPVTAKVFLMLPVRIQQYLRSVVARDREPVAAGAFVLYVHAADRHPFLNYAIPVTDATGGDGRALVRLARERRLVPRLEYLELCFPWVEAALAGDGFTREARLRLMTCSPRDLSSRPAEVELVRVDPGSLLVHPTIAVRNAAFDEPPPSERETAGWHGHAIAALIDGKVVGGAGWTTVIDGMSEIVGVGVAAPVRRQGIGTALASAAARAAFSDGASVALLTPGDDDTARVYERAGFRDTTAMLHLRHSDEPKVPTRRLQWGVAVNRDQRQVLVLCASPRPDGNSWLLAESLAVGARDAGHAAEIVDLGMVMAGMLRDCRKCRLPDGSCAIEDGYAEFLHHRVLPADALVYATPLYWYGMAATLKNFFDRLVCYISASYPRREAVVSGLRQKRVALLLASEERYPTAGLAVISQLQELSRYLHHEFVGVVNGIGNTRGEVRFDPADPVDAASKLGATIFELRHTDYNLDATRPNAVWPQAREAAHDLTFTPYADV